LLERSLWASFTATHSDHEYATTWATKRSDALADPVSHRAGSHPQGGSIQTSAKPMILEVAMLDVRSGTESNFERDFMTASGIICGTPGYVSHELQRCVERPNRYVLLVRWETVEAHTEGFRKSAPYSEWKKLLHHYYDPFPMVEHFTVVQENVANRKAEATYPSGTPSAGPQLRVPYQRVDSTICPHALFLTQIYGLPIDL
jgi:heme-degrading monooxygenase HmoA